MPHESNLQTFTRLLGPLQRPLESYARRMLRNPSLAEDALQDAVLAAWNRFEDFTPGTNFKAWIFKFVTFQVLNANRRFEPVNFREIPVDLAIEEIWDMPQAEAAFDLLLEDRERFVELLQAPLAAALARLTAAERACLLLRAIGEFSYREIHELLNMPLGSVVGYLSRARRRMRLFLGEHAAEHGWIGGSKSSSADSSDLDAHGGDMP